MNDYTQHPMYGFMRNHPEHPDVFDDEPLTEDRFDGVFDGDFLSFQWRVMLCVSAICDENDKDYYFRIERKALNRILSDWSLEGDAIDVATAAMDLAMPVIMDEGGE